MGMGHVRGRRWGWSAGFRAVAAVALAIAGLPARAADVSWIRDGDGSWDTPGYWSTNAVPSALDNVTIDVGGATMRTITIAFPTSAAVSELSCSEALVVSSSSSLSIAGAGVISGDLRMGSASTLSGTTGTLTLSGTSHFSDIGSLTIEKPLINTGTMFWNGSWVKNGSTGTLLNAPGGVIDDQTTHSSTTWGWFSSTAPLTNQGTLNKGGTQSTQIACPFNSSGAVNVNAAILDLAGGGTQTGPFAIADGATLKLSSKLQTFNAGASISGPGTLDIAFTPVFNIPIDVGTVKFSGYGTTTISTPFRTSSLLSLTASTLSFTPASTPTFEGAVEISGGTLKLATNNAMVLPPTTIKSGVLDATDPLTLDAGFTWSGGTLQGTGAITVTGGMTINGSASRILSGKTLTNTATADWTAGTIDLTNAAVFTNAVGATFIASAEGSLGKSPTTGTFNNAGEFIKNGPSTTTIKVPFNNTGTVQINEGTLALAGSMTYNSLPPIAPGATLHVAGGVATVPAGAVWNTPGSLRFSVTPTNWPAISANGVTFSGPTVNLAFPLNNTGPLTILGGTVTHTGAADVTALGSPINLNGGTFSIATPGTMQMPELNLGGGTLNSTQPVDVTGAFNWTAGTIGSGYDLRPQAPTVISGTDKTLAGHFVNEGTTDWTSGPLTVNGTFDNTATGLFNVSGDGAIDGTGTFVNLGKIVKSGETVAEINCGLQNSGTIQVDEGTLRLGGDATHSAAAEVAAGATLEFSGGNQTILPGGAPTGAGRIAITGGNVLMNGGSPQSITKMELAGGTLGGADPVTIAGDLLWSAGKLALTRPLNITGSLWINTAAAADMSGQVINNMGTITWEGGDVAGVAGATMTNLPEGTMVFNATATLGSGSQVGSLVNYGQIERTGNTGVSTLAMTLTNNGPIDVTRGTLKLTGSTISLAPVEIGLNGTLEIAGGGHIFHAGSIGGDGRLRVTGGTASILAVQSWQLNSTIEVAGGTLMLNSDAGPSSRIQVSDGSLNIGSGQQMGSLLLTGGLAAVNPGVPPVLVNHLTLSGGRLNLNDGVLVAGYTGGSPYADYVDLVNSGEIFTPLTAPVGGHAMLAVVDNMSLHITQLRGTPISDGVDFRQILLVYTYEGDVNLDGVVDQRDYVNLFGNMGTGASWFEGDVNLDGVTNQADYDLVAQRQGAGASLPLAAVFGPGSGNALPVPEPGAMLCLVAVTGLLVRRRRVET